MRNILLAFILIFCAATTLPAQNPYIPGTVQGGPPAPGTNSRSPLKSLERAANNVPGATILTDTFGNQRFSMFVYIADTCFTPAPTGNTSNLNSFLSNCAGDSTWYVDWTGKSTVLFAGGGGGGVNWYTVDDTTTDVQRYAYIRNNAYWTPIDPSNYEIGFYSSGVTAQDFYMSPTSIYLDYADLGGLEKVQINTEGIQLSTSNTASRAVDITTDTMNWASSFDPTFMSINYLADATYMYADSLKDVALGQFPSFPNVVFDGTEKGIVVDHSNDGIMMINGNGATGIYSYVLANTGSSEIKSTFIDGTYNYLQNGITSGSSQIAASIIENNSGSNYDETASVDLDNVKWNMQINDATAYGDTQTYFQAYQSNDGSRESKYAAMGEMRQSGGTAINASAYIGRASSNGSEQRARSNRMAWGVQQYNPGGTYLFDWLKIDLYDTITTKDAIQFYGDRYRWQNAEPSSTVGDTSLHFWAGIGGGTTNPGFMTLDQVCAHCANQSVNIYNSNGYTTDKTRIDTIQETITFLSADGDLNNIYPFRFELQDATANEPEMMVWKFPGTDSLKLNQSDQEIRFQSTNRFNIESADELSLLGDSIQYYKNGVGPMWRVTGGNSVIQGPEGNSSLINQVIHSSGSFAANGDAQSMEVVLRRAITGTAATELFLDGSSVQARLPGPNTIWTGTVKCTGSVTAVGNGTTIVVGDTYATWQPITIKRIGTATTLMTPVIGTTVEAWQDTNMGGSAFTITADNTTEALKITFTPPTLAGTTTVCRAVCTVNVNTLAF